MIEKERYNKLSSCVSDVYPDFATCLYSECAYLGLIESVYEYTKRHKEATSNDVLAYIDKLTGYYRPKVVIVDDDKSKYEPLQYV